MRVQHCLFGLVLGVILALPSAASAYSVRVHIYLANAIHDELARNMESADRPVLRLMAPDGAPQGWVEVDPFDAQAILEHPRFFRGGAIGPDNTAMTGLTDPSHAWSFSPFQQCRALYEEALAREASEQPGLAPEERDLSERAYALGCFLHGISDNSAHHLVNFFTGQTFTLFPTDQAEDGELSQSLVNVVRHIVTETQFEGGLTAVDAATEGADRELPGITSQPMDDASFEHRIAIDLVLRVYFDPSNETPTGMWQWLAGRLVEEKKQALRGPLGIDSSGSIIETMTAAEEPWDTDRAVVESYVGFLREGGLTPADYLVMLPEILADVKRFYQIVNAQGAARARAMDDEWIVRPSRVLERRMLRNAFAPRSATGERDWNATGPSRFEEVMELKAAELDAVMVAYIQTVENISNLNLIYGLAHTTREQRAEALQPLVDRLDAITHLEYTILFSDTTAKILETVGVLKGVLDDLLSLATQRIKEIVLAELHTYLDQLQAEFQRIKEEALARLDQQIIDAMHQLQEDILALREAATDAAKQEALDRLALDLEAGRDAFANFPRSVLWMNSYNSVVGAMAMPGVVDPGMYASGFFAGPVSFDASYQVEYNQLALCDSLRHVFYPCGTSAGELLQPDYRTCAPVENAGNLLNPAVECHRHDPTQFAEDPTAEDCRPAPLDDHLAPESARIHRYDEPLGSYTLAFPPSVLGDQAPTCYLATAFPLQFGDYKGDASGGAGSDTAAAGCAVVGGEHRGPLPALLVAMLLGVVLVRRRRRS